MALLGAISLAFGIMILADAATANLARWFGVDDSNGWLFVIVGGVVVLTAMLAPVFSRPTTATERARYLRARSSRP
jgi:hypothetical protein